MYVLGIKPSLGQQSLLKGGGRHDAGACLLHDGEISAVAEEERFSRNKHALDEFPEDSIKYVLDERGITLSDVDVIGIGRDRSNRFQMPLYDPRSYVPTSVKDVFFLFRELSTLAAVRRNIPVERVDQRINSLFRDRFTGDYYTISHHRCHAASAAYCATTDRSAVITIDARGEHDSTVLWNPELQRVKTFPWYNSIGLFYAIGVNYLGFRRGWDAGKVMGLASYGEYRDSFQQELDSLVEYGGGEYDVTAITKADNPVNLLKDRFGPDRTYPDEFTQRHKDFAYHLQLTTERIVTDLVEHHIDNMNTDKLSLSGGVAMNCKMNREIADLDCVAELFIQPAANDSGICLGAALEAYKQAAGTRPNPAFEHVYYGPKYSDNEIETTLEEAKLEYDEVDDICSEVAQLLANGDIVGWFQGRMEYGARALGNRSILANPTSETFLEKVNENVKHREPWRPFAPSLLHEARDEYLKNGEEAPFMILLDSVPETKQEEIEAVVHVDGTTRPQTVRRSVNERYYRVIENFESITGVPVVLNTSFNVAGEPIVESPEQAVQDFYSTGLDALAIEDYLLSKVRV